MGSPRRRTLPRPARRFLRNLAHGRFQRSLAAATAAGAVVTTAEIAIEHYRASFGDPWMWAPVAATPPVVAAAVAAVSSPRAARTWLPATAAVYTANGLIGTYLHVRGVARRPGGWHLPTYNVVMGPPLMAPGLMAIVGGMGLLAAVLRRER